MLTELRVLVIDDSEDDALMIIHTLRQSVCSVQWTRVDSAPDMEVALESQDFEAILCDYTMPYFDAMAALRIAHAHNLEIPFIVVSGTIGENAATEMARLGAHDYVWKGNLPRLLPSLERELEAAELRRSRKVGRQAQLQSGFRFRSLFERLPAPVVISRVNDGTIIRVNQAFVRVFSRDEISPVGHKIAEFFSTPVDRSRAAQTLNEDSHCIEFGVKGLDGAEHWVIANMEVIESGGEQVIVSSWTDITDRRKAEEVQLNSNAHLLNAIHVAKLGFWEYDYIKELFTFNDDFYTLFRNTVERVGGYTMSAARYLEMFVHSEDIGVVTEEIQKAAETADPLYHQEFEYRALYGDGMTGYIEMRLHIVKDSWGKTIESYGLCQDISERKPAEQEKDLLDPKRFVAQTADHT
jgi:PAS domain S-box-containing protein